MQSILIVDDLESIHEMLDAVIQPVGYQTAFATSGEAALAKLRRDRYDLVLTDINMKPMDGLTLLKHVKEIDPATIVIMMTGYANIENATRALKLGAFDFLTKPFKVDELMTAISRASHERQKRLQSSSKSVAGAETILAGTSAAVRKLKEGIARQAKSTLPLLISGPNGSEKSAIASLVHSKSDLSQGPFIAFTAAGHNGDFGADDLVDGEGNPGPAVESARGGYLYLADVDRLSIDTQLALGKLIGELKSQLRFVCSSSRDLERLVSAGEFEDALYFRIASSTLEAPGLRDRLEDIPALAMAHLATTEYAAKALDSRAATLMQAYRWPGGYTEFRECVEAAAAAAGDDSEVRETHLPDKLRDDASWPSLQDYLTEQSEAYRRQVLNACFGDKEKAAKILGCDPAELD